ncbi:ABC transporter substrate-binding protein, partial [Acinetobacter baumannii]
ANFLSIASIDTPDEKTVVFHLSQPDAPILTAMGDINAAIAPASAIADGSIATKAVGSGPFKLQEWSPNAKEVLVANAEWS